MNEPLTRAGVFLRILGNCIASTWRETDARYHIPKSRFREDQDQGPGSGGASYKRAKSHGKHYFRRVRNCMSEAWQASDRHYHIPKSRHKRAY